MNERKATLSPILFLGALPPDHDIHVGTAYLCANAINSAGCGKETFGNGTGRQSGTCNIWQAPAFQKF
ncbi:hypothetical protein KY495_01100 [Massilia sp. PAMC28688]|uniref:hypothetical protein n=1 Tax=Massilia sp. PAMC28688 TaxID=2861283 RepID=UPI001C630A01|nr:hypothetical protein [Massilia sp. PAMC28688]QYF93871.1 hypothetical protein KY495_01100 [Massilia sp. PAMC28688]